MKTTFDLPDPLLRRAKALAAGQGRPLRDLVAEALSDKLAAIALAQAPHRTRTSEWKAFEARLQKQPDGSYLNPEVPDDDDDDSVLQILRDDRRGWTPSSPFTDDLPPGVKPVKRRKA